MEITIAIKGTGETKDQLERAKRLLNDMYDEFNEVAKYLLKFYSNEPFNTDGGIYGEHWKDLNPNYLVWKADHYGQRNILVRSEIMRNSFRADVGKTLLHIYNTAPYFRFHQLGEGVPQRVIMKVDDARKKKIKQLIKDKLLERLSTI